MWWWWWRLKRVAARIFIGWDGANWCCSQCLVIIIGLDRIRMMMVMVMMMMMSIMTNYKVESCGHSEWFKHFPLPFGITAHCTALHTTVSHSLHCTIHCNTLHTAMHYTLHCTIHCIIHCTLHNTSHCSVSFTALSDNRHAIELFVYTSLVATVIHFSSLDVVFIYHIFSKMSASSISVYQYVFPLYTPSKLI